MQRRTKAFYNLVSATALLMIAVFAVWWFKPQHVADNFHGYWHIFDFVFFALLSYVIWHPLMMEVFNWAVMSHIKERIAVRPKPGLKVAFITTFVPSSESPDLLEKTLPAMIRADYPHDTWLLDEGDDSAAKTLCEQYGVKHFSRHGKKYYNTAHGKFAAKTKGGNHNAWYHAFGNKYDIVAQIDTDFIPQHNFLTRTLGYFRDPKVAFVGTPQVYGNMDNFIARGAAQQTYSFYGPILRGLYGMKTTLLIGANHIIRVAALREVDHYSGHLTEDLITGMKLHAEGWTSVYVNEALAIGQGPTTWQAYFNQQMRWAFGCIDILFRHSPKLLPKMKLRRAAYYYFLLQHYFMGVAMAIGILGLVGYFIFGVNSAQLPFTRFIELYGPLVLLAFLISVWAQRFNVRPKVEQGMMWSYRIMGVLVAPVFFLALLGVLRGKHLTFKVTPKSMDTKMPVERVSPKLFKIHFYIGLLCLVCLGFGIEDHRHSFVMSFWLIVTIISMLLIPAFIVLRPMVLIAYATAKQILRTPFDSTWGFRQKRSANSLSETEISETGNA